MKIYRIPFSKIKNALLRRTLMIVSSPFMVVGNWSLILYAAIKEILRLLLWVLLHIIFGPFRLFNHNFVESWHGRASSVEPAKD